MGSQGLILMTVILSIEQERKLSYLTQTIKIGKDLTNCFVGREESKPKFMQTFCQMNWECYLD